MIRPLIAALFLIALPAAASEEIEKTPQPLVTTETVTVFAKAFWRRPQANDHIIHAERREWLDTDGTVVKWQWFLVVEPSPQTREWLDTNPFLLSRISEQPSESNRTDTPEWFLPSAAIENALQNASGTQTLAFSSDGKRLYATDSGEGFSPQSQASKDPS